MRGADLSWLGTLDGWEASCVVPEDDSEVVRGAAPLDAAARAQLREQHIARLLARFEADRGRRR
jgi:hypothetical protein